MKHQKSSKINRLLLGIVALSLVFSFSFAPKKTNAWIGISDVNIDSASNILSYATAVWKAYLDNESWWKEWILDPILYAIAQELLSDITESTVNWINSGFEGSPLYDINFGDTVKNGLNEASGILIDEMGGADICNNLREGLSVSFEYEKTYEMQMKCTLNDVIDNVEDFYSDFTTGGWKTWVTLSVEPQNNPYGAYITSANEYDKMRSEKAQEVQSEIDSSKGFKSFKKCDEYSKDLNGNDTTNCKHWTIQTPGKTIEARMSKATGVDFGSLQMADEMDEIIGALLQQAMKAIFEEGSSSDSAGDSGGGGLTGADLSQDATPATIAEEMETLRVNLQIYYDYFTATSTTLTNGLHAEMRRTIWDQYMREENYWRLAQYCKNKGTTTATGIDGMKYMKEITEATEDEIQSAKGARAEVINQNIADAQGLYVSGFTDADGNSYKGVYDTLYTGANWMNVTSKILSAWKSKLTALQGIQRGDTNKLKMGKMGRESAKDEYDDQCCDIDFGTAVLCAINPFCQVCSIGLNLGDFGSWDIIDVCEELCPCEKMEEECDYKTGNNYRYCDDIGLTAEQKTRSLHGETCRRGDTCEGGTMRPTLDDTFCCTGGGRCVSNGLPYQYPEPGTPVDDDLENPPTQDGTPGTPTTRPANAVCNQNEYKYLIDEPDYKDDDTWITPTVGPYYGGGCTADGYCNEGTTKQTNNTNNCGGESYIQGGGWAIQTGCSVMAGSDQMYITNYGPKEPTSYTTARWTPDIGKKGTYEVWISYRATENRARSTNYYLKTPTALIHYEVDQKYVTGGVGCGDPESSAWVKLGEYELNEGSGAYVEMRNKDDHSEGIDAAGFFLKEEVGAVPL